MAINVNSNVSAMTAQRFVNNASSQVSNSMEQLSSGYKINSAQDDAAGLQISNRLNVQNRGLEVAVRNANDGISIAQTAEGALNETTNVLQRLRDLSLQASNGSNSKDDRLSIQTEVTALNDELNRIAETTSFAGSKLLNGSFQDRSFQIGADSGEAVVLSLQNVRSDSLSAGGMFLRTAEGKADDWTLPRDASLTVDIADEYGFEQVTFDLKKGSDLEEIATRINGQQDIVNTSVDGEGRLQIFYGPDFNVNLDGDFLEIMGAPEYRYETVSNIDVTSQGGAQRGIALVDQALEYVDSHRAELGAFQNRLGHAISNLNNIDLNVQASKSQIRDTDFAKTTTELTKSQILQQSSSSILAQAKQAPNSALSLLG
ncbi:flagellin [Vibrio sp. Isolate30]|jgi:flagellin|uniref:flagellin n=1 Tax=Vibrio sp. Isolate30 TaxID=2908536 RepID=UPI001EFEA52A|nr:flagellin [Vibrio sp. Isolate30]MCG9632343.1 flagellin [Vibrio sp. Isolate30]